VDTFGRSVKVVYWEKCGRMNKFREEKVVRFVWKIGRWKMEDGKKMGN